MAGYAFSQILIVTSDRVVHRQRPFVMLVSPCRFAIDGFLPFVPFDVPAESAAVLSFFFSLALRSSVPELTVSPVSAASRSEWSRLVDGTPDSTFFHRWEWRSLLCDELGYTDRYLAAHRDGVMVGLLPLVEVRSPLFGRNLTSLPFCSYAGPLVSGTACGESSPAQVTQALVRAAVDLARHLGCRVIAASASDAKLAVIQETYAPDAVVNVSKGFKDRVKEITGGRGADVIFDPVGGDVFDESVRCIAFDGRILSIGFTSGRLPVLPVNYALIKGFSVMGVRAGEYGRQFPERGRENNAAIWKLADEGAVHPRVHAEYPLDGWREAFDTLAERTVVGKTIIRPDL